MKPASRSISQLARHTHVACAAVLLPLVLSAACGKEERDSGDADVRGGSVNQSQGGREASAGAGSSSGGSTSAGASSAAAGEPGGVSLAGAAGESSSPTPGTKQYPDVTFDYDAGAPDPGPLTPDAACAREAIQTSPLPLDMYLVLDRSGSMNLPQSMPVDSTQPGGGDCNVGDPVVSRWCYAINALDGFFGSEVAQGTGVALQFFPAGGCATSPSPLLFGCCSSGACCAGGAEKKPDVPLSELPAAREALAEALNRATPWADRTPIEAALRGIVSYTQQARRPGRQMMGLLVTDGGPEGCSASSQHLANIVLAHREKTGIPTYVVATQGAAYSWLEPIAVAGGAPVHTARCAGGVRPCHFYDVGNARPDVFIDVLQQIQRSAISCSYAVPSADTGLSDPNEVSLSIRTKAGRELQVERVASSGDCGAAPGFFYDDPAAPATLDLCPASCSALRAADGGQVNILLGCQGS